MINHHYGNAPLKCLPCKNIERYSGPLRKQMKAFILQKRAFGLKYDQTAYHLGVFDRFLFENDAPENCLRKEDVTEFCAKRAGESYRYFVSIGNIIRQFGEHMATMGYESYILPRYETPKSSFVPYIYSHEEISKLFAELDKRKYNKHSPYSHKVYPMLFRVLYGCGMRIGETLHLKLRDVDLKNGVFRLENTKNNSERLVMMSESLLKECRIYSNELHCSGNLEYFFPSPTNGVLTNSSVHDELKRVMRVCEIPKRARIHDFRHTFAVHSLNHWAKEGKDIYVCLPLLSKYLGHSTLTGTEYYLRMTAEVYPEVAQTFETYFGGVIPEVTTFEKTN